MGRKEKRKAGRQEGSQEKRVAKKGRSSRKEGNQERKEGNQDVAAAQSQRQLDSSGSTAAHNMVEIGVVVEEHLR